MNAMEPLDYEKEEMPLKINIAGFGNFGQFLAKTMVTQGHTVLAHSRTNYTEAAAKLGIRFLREVDNFCEEHPEIILLCSLPTKRLKKSTLFTDILFMKELPPHLFLQVLPAEFDVLCTHVSKLYLFQSDYSVKFQSGGKPELCLFQDGFYVKESSAHLWEHVCMLPRAEITFLSACEAVQEAVWCHFPQESGRAKRVETPESSSPVSLVHVPPCTTRSQRVRSEEDLDSTDTEYVAEKDEVEESTGKKGSMRLTKLKIFQMTIRIKMRTIRSIMSKDTRLVYIYVNKKKDCQINKKSPIKKAMRVFGQNN